MTSIFFLVDINGTARGRALREAESGNSELSTKIQDPRSAEQVEARCEGEDGGAGEREGVVQRWNNGAMVQQEPGSRNNVDKRRVDAEVR